MTMTEKARQTARNYFYNKLSSKRREAIANAKSSLYYGGTHTEKYTWQQALDIIHSINFKNLYFNIQTEEVNGTTPKCRFEDFISFDASEVKSLVLGSELAAYC